MSDLLLELGSEELPAGFIDDAARALSDGLVKALDDHRLSHGGATHWGTPRRLAVFVRGVGERQPDVEKELLGPPAKAAFDATGKPTQAALGFARVNGLTVEQLKRVSTPKGEYVAAHVKEIGKPAGEILPGIFKALVGGLRFPKSMRWGALESTYARPLQWILALHGEKVVEFEYAAVKSDDRTRGHRFLNPEPFQLAKPADYAAALRERHVEVDHAARKAEIQKQIRDLAAKEKAQPSAESEKALLDQVANLVEWPTPVLGSFDAPFLEIPREVLLSEMTVHQRYFGLDRPDGSGTKLTNQFVVIAGTPVRDQALSRHGYERVLRARLSDARFFYDEDRKKTLESRVASLGSVVFQQKLGTVLEKVERVAQLAEFLAHELKLGEGVQKTVARAARLAKADQVTGMVGEFPELSGIMGGYYALADGETKEVAAAIRDQYLPRFAGDALPGGPGNEGGHAAALLGIADRLDTLVGLFGIGKPPTGSADPFALRRSCLGIIVLCWHKHLRFSLTRALEKALQLLGPKLTEAPGPTLEKLREFFRGRLKALFSEDFAPDVVEAVLVSGFDDLWAARKRLEGLGAMLGRGDFLPLAVAFKRAVSILEKAPTDRLTGEVDSERLVEEPERFLWKSQMDIRRRVDERLAKADFQGALEEMASLKPAIDLFFDKVLVMADDIPTRENRFRLLLSVRTLFGQVADLSQIQGEARAAPEGERASQRP